MNDYYRLLEVNYNEPTQIIINACKKKIFEYKALPYLNEQEKEILKLIKKSYYIFTNPELKQKYDELYIKNITNNNQNILTNRNASEDVTLFSGAQAKENTIFFNESESIPYGSNEINNNNFEINNNQNLNNSFFEFPNDNQDINNQFINDPIRHNQNIDIRSSKKNIQNQNYLVDRIFNFQSTNNNYNLKNNELLRPKNAGLSSDEVVEFDKPMDYQETSDFLPYNFDS